MWKQVQENFEVHTHPTCGTHVHLHPLDGFNLWQRRDVAKGIAVFEPQVRDIVFFERKDYP